MNHLIIAFGAIGGIAAIGAWFQVNYGDTVFVSEAKLDYDYVIVGGGTAGCVLARRLAEDPRRYRVLLLEAGTKPPLWSWIPVATPKLQRTTYDWSYQVESQKQANWGMHNHVGLWPRGKMLGGSQQLNYMVHMLGSPGDHDAWREKGIEDWGYDEMLHTMENITCTEKQECTTTDCPICVSSPEESVLLDGFLEGAESLGIFKENLNSGSEIGVMPSQSTLSGRWKWTTIDGFLRKLLYTQNSNLHVLLKAEVKKVAIIHGKARGVEYYLDDSLEVSRVRAMREVILSAGTIGSPEILQNSGVGPAELLIKHGIAVVEDLPVGHGLQDHLNFPAYFHLEAPIGNNLAKTTSLDSIYKYLRDGSGPIGNSNVLAVGRAPFNWQNISSEDARADLGLILFNLGSVEPELSTYMTNMDLEIHESFFPDCRNNSKEGFIILNSCLHPKSRGKVEIQGRGERVMIDPNYFSDPWDIQCAIKALKLAVALGTSKPMKAFGAKLHLPKPSKCMGHKVSLKNDKYLECIIKTGAFTGYHPMSTCRMGPEGDESRVTDTHLRVVGIRGLRVVDASIFPTQLAGTPNSAVIAVAEKAATLILKDAEKLY